MHKNINKINCFILILLLGTQVILGCDETERHVKIEQSLPEGGVLINDLQENHDGFSGEDSYHNRFSFIPSGGGKKEAVGESSCLDSNLDMNPEVTVAGKVHILKLECFPGLRLFIRSEDGAWAQYPLNPAFYKNYPQWVKNRTPADEKLGCSSSLLGIDKDKAAITVECRSVQNIRMTFMVVEGGKRLVMTAFTHYPNPAYDVGSLNNQLADTSGHYRASAAIRLGVLKARQSVDILISALDDHDDRVSESAAEALGRVGDRKAVKPLILLLASTKGDRAETAATALGLLKDTRAVEPLIRVLLDKNQGPSRTYERKDYVRASAAEALGDIGDPRAIEPLAAVLKNYVKERWFVRRAAANALGKINDPRSIKALTSSMAVYRKWTSYMNVDNKNVRSAVVFALEKLVRINSGGDMKEKKAADN